MSGPTPSVTVAGVDLDALEKVAREAAKYAHYPYCDNFIRTVTPATVLKLIAAARASRPTPEAEVEA